MKANMYSDVEGNMNISNGEKGEEIEVTIKDGMMTITAAHGMITLTPWETTLVHVLLNVSKAGGENGQGN